LKVLNPIEASDMGLGEFETIYSLAARWADRRAKST